MSSDIGTDAATRTIAESRVLSGPNPFDLDPRSDFLASPRHDVALWSETMFFQGVEPGGGGGGSGCTWESCVKGQQHFPVGGQLISLWAVS